MKRFFALSVALALTALSLVGCGGSSKATAPQAGAVYVTGEDAPLESVVSLNLTINSITLRGQEFARVGIGPDDGGLRAAGGTARTIGLWRSARGQL
jgi:hypothetical protein